MMRRCLICLSLVAGLLTANFATAEPKAKDETAGEVVGTITGELGFLDPLFHKVQFSKDGTYFDYIDEGGQDVLFNFVRLSAGFRFSGRHHVIFLYQPLKLETEVTAQRDVKVNDLTFPDGTPLKLTYGFPFYRASYLYDLSPAETREIALGGSLQLRNATINFASQDGELFRAERDVGPVPIIKFRMRLPLPSEFWFGFEADGFYAPIKYLNGGDSDVTGAIVDASLRAGRPLSKNIDGFINVRYLAGGGEGTDEDDTGPGDGFVKNWLHFATVSVGFSYSLRLTSR